MTQTLNENHTEEGGEKRMWIRANDIRTKIEMFRIEGEKGRKEGQRTTIGDLMKSGSILLDWS